MLTWREEAGDLDVGADRGGLDDVGRGGAVDDDRIGRGIAGGVYAQIDVDVGHAVPAKSLIVTVSAPPSALSARVSTSSTSMTMLPTLRVNKRRLPLAEAVEDLGAAGAVETQRVGIGPALDDVAAVARIPNKGVVAGAQRGRVDPWLPSTCRPSPPMSVRRRCHR